MSEKPPNPPTNRATFYRNYWNHERTALPEERRTYETFLHGQWVTVRVLPSASEATDLEWVQFTAMPQLQCPGPDRLRSSPLLRGGCGPNGGWGTMSEDVFTSCLKKGGTR
jgi:hypothetical protein